MNEKITSRVPLSNQALNKPLDLILFKYPSGSLRHEMLSAAWKARLPFIYVIKYIFDNYISNLMCTTPL